MRPIKSEHVQERMGIFKDLSDVPDRYRLRNFTDRFDGVDVYQTFAEEYAYPQGESEWHIKEVDRMGGEFREFMSERGKHHALPTPTDAEAYATHLFNRPRTGESRAFEYWARIDSFFEWLLWRVDYPHRYNPVRMSVLQGTDAQKMWDRKIADARRSRAQKREET